MAKILPNRGCAFCQKGFRPTRHWQQYCGPSCRRAVGKDALKTEYVCTYCGLLSDTIDHIPPVSIRPVLVNLGLDANYPFVTVRACRECNCALSDLAYWTVEQRREYIARRLERKYRKYLDLPEWTEKELNELGHTLKKATLHGLAIKAVTMKRLECARPDRPLSFVVESRAHDTDIKEQDAPSPSMEYIDESDEVTPQPRAGRLQTLLLEVPVPCITCDKLTREKDHFCSEVCEFIASGRNHSWKKYKQRLRSLAKEKLKTLPKERRRELKMRRLTWHII